MSNSNLLGESGGNTRLDSFLENFSPGAALSLVPASRPGQKMGLWGEDLRGSLATGDLTY